MLDIVVIFLILGFCLIGYKRGIIETILRIVAVFVAIFFARSLHGVAVDFLIGTAFYDFVYDWLVGYVFFAAGIGTQLAMNVAAAILLLFFFTIVFNILLSFLRVINFVPIVGSINKNLGAIAGLFGGFLMVWSLLIFYELFFDSYLLAASPFTRWLMENNMVMSILFPNA